MSAAKDLEIEIKIQLESFTNYLKLIGFLGSIDEEEHQTSAFFDTPDRKLGEKGYGLRVRAESNRGLVTVKSLVSQSDAMAIRHEIESEIDTGRAREVIRGYSDLLEMEVDPVKFITERFSDLSLVKIVQFDNSRQKKKFQIGDYEYILEIDKTEFSDGSVDYELEVELRDQGQFEVVVDRLRKMFQSLGIPFEKQTRSKFERALERTAVS
jgi:inorganic triphosphatase YgiF